MPDPNPAPKPLTCSPHSGWEFIFNLKNLYLVDGSSVALLDRYAYELLQPAERCAGGRDLYLALEDLRRIYAPDFDVLEGPEPGMRTIRHAGLEVSDHREQPPDVRRMRRRNPALPGPPPRRAAPRARRQPHEEAGQARELP